MSVAPQSSRGGRSGRPDPTAAASNDRDNLQPAMLLIGIDRSTARIQLLQVDNLSAAEGWSGALKDNVVTFDRIWSACSRETRFACWSGMRMIARPGSEYVTMEFQLAGWPITFIMKRQAASEQQPE